LEVLFRLLANAADRELGSRHGHLALQTDGGRSRQHVGGRSSNSDLVNATAATLRHGGIEVLRGLLEEWSDQSGAQVYVVEDGGRELLGRVVAPEVLAQACRLAQENREQRIARLETATQRQYLFVILAESEAAPFGPPPSPLAPISIGIQRNVLIFKRLLLAELT